MLVQIGGIHFDQILKHHVNNNSVESASLCSLKHGTLCDK